MARLVILTVETRSLPYLELNHGSMALRAVRKCVIELNVAPVDVVPVVAADKISVLLTDALEVHDQSVGQIAALVEGTSPQIRAVLILVVRQSDVGWKVERQFQPALAIAGYNSSTGSVVEVLNREVAEAQTVVLVARVPQEVRAAVKHGGARRRICGL